MFARRWAALVGVVVLVFVVLAIVLRGHSPAFYWEGEPMANAPHVLAEAQAAMRATASADEGVVSPQSSCYFSLPNRSAHDVAPYIRCGPVFLPWSAPADAWLTYRLRASPTSSGVKLSVASSSSPPAATVALAKGEVLRRPGGGAPASRDAGLSPPAVPRQRPGWTGVLKSPPTGLEPAPVGDLIGDWGRSYRLVAFGEVGWLPSRLGPAGRRDAVNPAGGAHAGRTSGDGRPQAKVLLPARGQVLAVAELALSPGEAAAPVASGPNASGPNASGPNASGPNASGPNASGPTRPGRTRLGRTVAPRRAPTNPSSRYLPMERPRASTSHPVRETHPPTSRWPLQSPSGAAPCSTYRTRALPKRSLFRAGP